jgi:hypothetical protein
MSQVKREMDRLESLNFEAIEVAKQAGAVKECQFPGHSDQLLTQWDDDANKMAFAIGTNRWKTGEIDGTRQDFMDAIKEAIDTAPDECPECDRMMSKD